MNTQQFCELILPRQGLYVLAVFPYGMGKGKPAKHVVCTTIKQLVKSALHFDRKGIPTFHACASYAEHRKKRMRVADNAAYVRGQWLDVDVGEGKDYVSRKAAVKELARACRELQIPRPLIVGSGAAGIHVYWPFSDDVAVADAHPCSEAFSEALRGVGFAHDTTRTCDMASILRPVGTHNRKGDPVEVKVLMQPSALVNPVEWMERFKVVSVAQAIDLPWAGSADDWATGTNDYRESSIKKIVRKCRAAAYAAKQQGNIPEPYWRSMLGLIKYTVEGEKAAHALSKGHPDYDRAETQEKYDAYAKPPTSCTQFDRVSGGKCAGCPHQGRIKSPIRLGEAEAARPDARGTVDTQPVKVLDNVTGASTDYSRVIPDNDSRETLPFFPHDRFSWDGSELHALVEAKDGPYWTPIGQTLYYPFLRYETEDQTRAMKICALTDPHKGRWRVFDVETTKAAEAQSLAYALGAHEILYMGDPATKNHHKRYVQDVLEGIRQMGLETTTYSTFGWHDGGFVVGDKKYTATTPSEVFLGSKVPEDIQRGFGQKGDTATWAHMIDQIYNRAGAEAYQFVIAAGFAAPLVSLPASDLWHGIPIGLTGAGGLGKSTTAAVATSMWGNPKRMMIQANDEGTTMKALIQRVSTMRNLPLVLDEITGRDTQELQSMLFALSNGKPKLRLKSDGTEISPGQSWDTITFITGNLSITKMLADSDRVKADATQVRVFEIMLEDDYNTRVFKGLNAKEMIEGRLLGENYGYAGQEFLRYVIANKEKVTDELNKQRAKFAAANSEESKERFYYDLIATVMVAAGIAKRLGLINFDLKRMRKWAMGHVLALRNVRSHSLDSPEDYLQSFLSHLHQHTLHTKYYRDGRQKLPGTENVIEPMREPLARNAVEDRRFIITLTAFNDWCHGKKVNPNWLRMQLEKGGYMLPVTKENERQRICKGTRLSGTQARCVELNYEQVDSHKLMLPEYIGPVEEADQK